MSDVTLAGWLLEQIAADEAAARAALRKSSYEWSDNAFTEAVELAEGEGAVKEATDHIARHDPARVLAECEAKRRIVELHVHEETRFEAIARVTGVPAEAIPYRACVVCGRRDEEGDLALGDKSFCPTLRLLALPYADHPDYDESWRP